MPLKGAIFHQIIERGFKRYEKYLLAKIYIYRNKYLNNRFFKSFVCPEKFFK